MRNRVKARELIMTNCRMEMKRDIIYYGISHPPSLLYEHIYLKHMYIYFCTLYNIYICIMVKVCCNYHFPLFYGRKYN